MTTLIPVEPKSSSLLARTKKEIQVHTDFHDEIWAVEVDSGQIEQALLNLYVNAWQAMPEGGALYLKTQNVMLDSSYAKPFKVEPGKYVEISVSIPAWASTGKPGKGYLSRFLPPKKWVGEPAWAWHPFTAS